MPPRPATVLQMFAALALLLAPTATAATGGPDRSTGVASDDAAIRASTGRALDALADAAPTLSDADALRLAFHAYFAYTAEHPERVHNPYLFFVDYGLDNATPRGWIFDMAELTLVDGPFTVAHGSGSSASRNGVPTRFSNRPGSRMSSLGLFLTQETYRFRGKSGGRPYSSVGLRLQGVSGPFNEAARRRGIVAHGAPYVTARDAGRSHGCPAMEQRRADRLLPMIARGGLVFLYSPRDRDWLTDGPWVRTARLGV